VPRKLEATFSGMPPAAGTPSLRRSLQLTAEEFEASESEDEPMSGASSGAVLPPASPGAPPIGGSDALANWFTGGDDAAPAPSEPTTFDPSRLDRTAPIVRCCFCKKSSVHVRWYVVLTVRGGGGVLLFRPDGDLCFQHGATCQVYPKMTVAEILHKYQGDCAFKSEFDVVSVRVVSLCDRQYAMDSVFQDSILACECFVDVGAVPVANFTAKWQPPGGSFRIPCSAIKVPPHFLELECVFLQPIRAIPTDVFFYTYRMKAATHLALRHQILDADRLVRLGQAGDFFETAGQRHEINQGSKFTKTGAIGSGVVTVDMVEQRYAEEQRRLSENTAMGSTQLAAASIRADGGHTVVERVVGGQAVAVVEPTDPAQGLPRRAAGGASRPAGRPRSKPASSMEPPLSRARVSEPPPGELDASLAFHLDGDEQPPPGGDLESVADDGEDEPDGSDSYE